MKKHLVAIALLSLIVCSCSTLGIGGGIKELEFVGSWPEGRCRDLAVDGNGNLYGAFGGMVYHLSIDGDKFTKVWEFRYRGIADLDAYGDRLYILDQRLGLDVVDVSNPDKPKVVRKLPGRLGQRAMAVVENGIVLQGEDKIISCRNARDLKLTGALGEDLKGTLLSAENNTAAVTHSDTLIGIYTVGAKGQLEKVSTIELGSPVRSADLRDGILYIAGGKLFNRHGKTEVDDFRSEGGGKNKKPEYAIARYDLSNPAAPRKLKDLGPYDLPAPFVQFRVRDGFVYTSTNNSFSILDAVASNSSPLANYPCLPKGADHIALIGDRLIYNSPKTDPKGLRLLDISNPAKPKLLDNYLMSHQTEGIFVRGQYAYLAHGVDGLRILDCSNPKHPVPLGRVDSPGLSEDIWVDKDTAYIADGITIFICDISDPRNPKNIATIENPKPHTMDDWVEGVRIVDDILYVAAHTNVWIYDVKDPSRPKKIGRAEARNAKELTVKGDYVYVADAGGLRVLDVKDKTKPRKVYFHEWGPEKTATFDVEIEGDTLFLTNGKYGIQIMDISDPENPALIKTLDPGTDNLQGLHLYDGYLYVATVRTSGVLKFDVSNPAEPKLVAKDEASGCALNLDIDEKYVYVADFQCGVCIIKK
jgi:hypothetical protein